MFICHRPQCGQRGTNLGEAPSVVCVKCNSIYCSEECLHKSAEHRCVEVTKEEKEFVYKGIFCLPSYVAFAELNEKKYFMFPGPIQNAPPKLIPVTEEPFFSHLPKVWLDMIKQRGIYYIALQTHLPTLWLYELTTEQKAQLKLMINYLLMERRKSE